MHDVVSSLLLRWQLYTMGRTCSYVHHLLERRMVESLKWLFHRLHCKRDVTEIWWIVPGLFQWAILPLPASIPGQNMGLSSLWVQGRNGHWHSFGEGFPPASGHNVPLSHPEAWIRSCLPSPIYDRVPRMWLELIYANIVCSLTTWMDAICHRRVVTSATSMCSFFGHPPRPELENTV